MIVRHSKKILEQLSEIENLITKIESYMDESGMESNRKTILMKVLKEREAMTTSRNKKEN